MGNYVGEHTYSASPSQILDLGHNTTRWQVVIQPKQRPVQLLSQFWQIWLRGCFFDYCKSSYR